MELVFLLILPAALWTHSWHLLGFYNNPRSLGLIGGSVAIALFGLVLFGGDIIVDKGTQGPLSVMILAWVMYSALLAAVGLWGFDERTLGFYSLLLSVLSLVFVAYYFLGDALLLDTGTSAIGFASGEAGTVSLVMGIYSLVLAVSALVLFFHLAPPFERMRTATGWVFLVASIVGVALGGLSVLGLPIDK